VKKSKLAVATAMITFGVLGSGCASQGGGTESADYPNKSVRVIVPYDAGSNTDNVGRSIATCLEEETGQSFLVENQSGGSGMVGTTAVANAQPDGYTLGLLTASGTVLAPLVTKDVSYSTDDFKPIGIVAEVPNVMFVAADSPYKNAQEIFEAAKIKSGALTIATQGENSLTGGMIGQALQRNYEIEFGQVPVDSNAEMLRGVLAGDYPAAFTTASQDVLKAEAAGDIRFLATPTETPPAYLADAATFASLGYDKLLPPAGQGAIYFLTATKEVPDSVIEALQQPMQRCLTNDKLIERIGEQFVPEEFTDGSTTGKQLQELSAALEQAIK